MLEEAHAADGMALWPPAPTASPFEQAAANQLEARVEAAVARLPPVYREVVLLVVVEGLEPAEAAEICGVSASAMRQRLKRARDLLAQWIDIDRTRPIVLREVKI
jgi:RNA polymerase sigma factor (sigma-70 family)